MFPVDTLSLSDQIAKQYGVYLARIPVMSYEDCYAGKFCAALDRQHPRDLFDVWMMLEQGISENLKNAFIVYLLSNNRPIHELLAPHLLEISDLYCQEFLGMQLTEVKLEALLETRLQLIKMLKNSFTERDRAFILSVKSGKPNFDWFPIKHIIHLPGIQWKIINIQKMDLNKRLEQLEQLAQLLGVTHG